MSGTLEQIEFIEAPIGEVVLNNPGRLNAMDSQFFERLGSIFETIRESRTVRVVLIRANGRAFSIGLDKEQSLNLIPPAQPGDAPAKRVRMLHETISRFQTAMLAVRNCPKPVVAAVNGFCLGGGLDLACAADIRLCSVDAQFAVHETRIAMVADLGTLTWLPRIIGRGPAREMAFTGDPVGADLAKAYGLVNAVFSDRLQLTDGARKFCASIARNSPSVVAAVKELMDDGERDPEARSLRQVALWNAGRFFSADLVEAHQAATERRDPIWSDD